MSKFLGASLMYLTVISLAACATGGAGLDREAGTRGTTHFMLSAAGDPEAVFPVARNPRLPTADRISHEIRSALNGVASVDVRLCVAPDGHVQGMSLVHGSSLAAFDDAVLADAADWQFSGTPGSSTFASTLRTCEVATITYRPHQ